MRSTRVSHPLYAVKCGGGSFVRVVQLFTKSTICVGLFQFFSLVRTYRSMILSHLKGPPSLRTCVRTKVLGQTPISTVSTFRQHLSSETRNTCLSFSTGIPLHSKVSCIEQSQARRSIVQSCFQIISFVIMSFPTSSMCLGAINEAPRFVSLGGIGSVRCLS